MSASSEPNQPRPTAPRTPGFPIHRTPALLGMVHVGALPGTPRAEHPPAELAQRAVAEAQMLAEAGFDAIILENMHDRPYLRRSVGPEIVAAMTRIASAVREAVDLPIGLQILAGANREALAVTHAIGGRFIRAEGFIFASVADEGMLDEADAGPLLRYRRRIGAHESIALWCDIQKKHASHALTGDLDLPAHARAAAFFGADGLIVTGRETGEPVDPDDLAVVREVSSLPVIVGSGATPEHLPVLFRHADAVIVGSHLKRDGRWMNELDPERVRRMAEAADEARADRD